MFENPRVTIKEPTIQEAIKESMPQVMQSKRRKNKGIEKSTSFDLGHFFEGKEKRARSPSPPDAEDEDRTEEGGRNRRISFRQSSGIPVYKKPHPLLIAPETVEVEDELTNRFKGIP